MRTSIRTIEEKGLFADASEREAVFSVYRRGIEQLEAGGDARTDHHHLAPDLVALGIEGTQLSPVEPTMGVGAPGEEAAVGGDIRPRAEASRRGAGAGGGGGHPRRGLTLEHRAVLDRVHAGALGQEDVDVADLVHDAAQAVEDGFVIIDRIEIAKDELDIDLKKNFDTPQSIGSGKTKKK